MYTRSYQEDGRLLFLEGSGVLTGPELIATPCRLVEDGDQARGVQRVLVLLHDVTRLDVSASDFQRIIEIDRRLVVLIPRAVVAIVAPKDEVFGMARMWEMMGAEFTGWNTRGARSRAEADEWLNAGRKR